MTCNFSCIYLFICFRFVYLVVNVMSFRVLTVDCQTTELAAGNYINLRLKIA